MTDTIPSKSGGELCANCKQTWRQHEGEKNRCRVSPYGNFKPSGRVEERSERRVEQHYHPGYYSPPRQQCHWCHGDHDGPCRVMRGSA